MKPKTALIMVDLQNDFCQGGALAVPEGDAVVPLANQLQPYFDLVIATKDWHPADHESFAANHPGRAVGDVISLAGIEQILWPTHCVQGTHGAEFHPQLEVSSIQKIFLKGTNKSIDSYSTFFDNAYQYSTGLAEYLTAHEIKEVYVLGLATDYCVKFSCLDAVQAGFKTYLVIDACRGVELRSGDVSRAVEDMRRGGVEVVTVEELLKQKRLGR